jgi:hypothetical protein
MHQGERVVGAVRKERGTHRRDETTALWMSFLEFFSFLICFFGWKKGVKKRATWRVESKVKTDLR